MFSARLIILAMYVIVSGINCTRTQEKIHGEGICQYPENCTQPYGIPPPKPKIYSPPPAQPVPTGNSPYSPAVTPPPAPPAAPIYPAISPPPPPPSPSPPAVEGQYSSPSGSIPPPNPYTYLNETMDSADAPLPALPLFPSTAVFYILFLYAYYA